MLDQLPNELIRKILKIRTKIMFSEHKILPIQKKLKFTSKSLIFLPNLIITRKKDLHQLIAFGIIYLCKKIDNEWCKSISFFDNISKRRITMVYNDDGSDYLNYNGVFGSIDVLQLLNHHNVGL